MTISKNILFKPWRQLWLSALLALVAWLYLSGLAAAEELIDPPRIQTVGNYTVSFIAPEPGGNYDTLKDLTFRFKLTDRQGQPALNLQLKLTALRDYSGQVKKEHNGPRTPNIGPVSLQATGTPGEYQANLQFGFNGHWRIEVDGPNLGPAKASFRLPVGTSQETGVGIGLDWLLWVGLAFLVITVVVVVGRKGEVFPVPNEELEPPTLAPASVVPPEADQANLAVSGSSKD